jgi:hypothetical protein
MVLRRRILRIVLLVLVRVRFPFGTPFLFVYLQFRVLFVKVKYIFILI